MSEKSTRRDVLKWTGAGAAALAAGGLPEPALAKPPFFKLYLMIFNNLQSRMIWTDLIGKQFARLEWFRDVVVSAGLETHDPVDGIGRSRHHDDPDAPRALAQPAREHEPVLAGQSDIEQHQRGEFALQ